MRVQDCLKFLLPDRICPLCRETCESAGEICNDCLEDLPWLASACYLCANPLPATGLCPDCLLTPPDCDRTLAVMNYQFPVDRLIHHYKYGTDIRLASLFSTLMQAKILACVPVLPDLLLPVPLSHRRLFRRGFNQTGVMAGKLGARLSIPVNHTTLIRHRHTRALHSLSTAERQEHLRGAFDIRGTLAGRRVAIIEDIITTGTTLREVSRVCRDAGAVNVEVWALARAVLR